MNKTNEAERFIGQPMAMYSYHYEWQDVSLQVNRNNPVEEEVNNQKDVIGRNYDLMGGSIALSSKQLRKEWRQRQLERLCGGGQEYVGMGKRDLPNK